RKRRELILFAAVHKHLLQKDFINFEIAKSFVADSRGRLSLQYLDQIRSFAHRHNTPININLSSNFDLSVCLEFAQTP
ncbi:MAG: hypothetical protein IKV00_00250, partial [Clostridia bacterium]|nr:hypothetical protein [Clostridia bacterium]